MKIFKSLMLSLIVLLVLRQKPTLAQHIPRLSNAVSQTDSIKTLQYQVVALDARLTICENAHADSTIAHQKSLKAISKKRFWTGLKRGVGITLGVQTVIFLFLKIKP